MRTGWLAAAMLAAVAAAPAAAKDDTPCGADLICASNPTTVAAQLMRSGYKALLSKDELGDPMIESAASGYDFYVMFYGCENHARCDSVQFYATFDNDDGRGAEFVNKWNASKRFLQMSINDRNKIVLRYDMTTVGGVPRKNMADMIDWWNVLLGDLNGFFDANPAPGAKPAGTAATTATS